MSERSKYTGMPDGFDILFKLGCRQFGVQTKVAYQTVYYEVTFWVPIVIGEQNGLSVVVRGTDMDDPFTKAVKVASELLETHPRVICEKECTANAC